MPNNLITKFYIPHILLQEFVQCIMIIDANVSDDDPPVICPYPPTPQNSLFIYLNDRISMRMDGSEKFILQARAVIVGPQISRVTLDLNRKHKAVRIGFHPGGLFRLLGIPLRELIDKSYDAEEIFGTEIHNLVLRLQEAADFDTINHLVEIFLLKKLQTLKPALPFDLAMLELMNLNGVVNIERIASMACLSLRQFERVSKERIGIPPKLFARLVRFSKAYRLRENFPDWSWTHIAYESGYFDQMHFIRDFKEFAGVTPGIIEKELDSTPIRLQADLRI